MKLYIKYCSKVIYQYMVTTPETDTCINEIYAYIHSPNHQVIIQMYILYIN